MYYRIAEIGLLSDIELPSFKCFECELSEFDIRLEATDEKPVEGSEIVSGNIMQRKIDGGWFFKFANKEKPESGDYELRNYGLLVSSDYSFLRFTEINKTTADYEDECLVRMALECYLARRGLVSLHSSCIDLNGKAIAFCGPSGAGKSTRARAFIDALGAELISGDRPLIDVNNLIVYGAPWDGKEKCYRNVCFPLGVIFDIRRSKSQYIRMMGSDQRKKLLLRQCFLPMWDTETAVIQMGNISRLAEKAEILRAFCGKNPKELEELWSFYQTESFKEERTDIKAQKGYFLSDIDGEIVLMPLNVEPGKRTVALMINVVSAFVWEKLKYPMSRDDLLTAILDEFDVEEEVAAEDLDRLLRRLRKDGFVVND